MRIEYIVDQLEEVHIKVFTLKSNHKILGVFWVWKCANFQEWELYDMLRILYYNHPWLFKMFDWVFDTFPGFLRLEYHFNFQNLTNA